MLHRSKIIETLRALGNQIMGITFIKKNGDVRSMSCRARVSKYVKGVNPGGSAKPDNSQVTMYEMKGTTGAENYRSVNLDTITSIRCWGIEAEVTPDPIVSHVDVSTDYDQTELQLVNVA
jgi:hypothetical protein